MRNQNGRLAVNRYVSNAWTGWTELAGLIGSDSSCTERGTREVVCAARNEANALVFTRFNGATWSVPAVVGGKFHSAPSCARVSATKLICVGRSATGGLSYATYSNAAWSAVSNLAITGGTYSPPSCATDGGGGVVCNTLNGASNVLASRYTGTAWQSTINITGVASDAPTCVRNGVVGGALCLVRGNLSAFINRYNGGTWALGSWSGFVNLGGAISTRVQCANPAGGRIVCTTLGIQVGRRPYSNTFNGTSWTGWIQIATTAAINETACAAYDSTNALCVFTGPNNQLSSRIGS